jgi:lipid A ethanolaminephosphotransferase
MNLSLFRRFTAPALLLTAMWLVLVVNTRYWHLLWDQVANPWFFGSLVLFTLAIMSLVLSLLTFGRLTRFVLVVLLCVSAAAAYFMDSLGIMIDREMVENILQTDRAEAMELLNARLVFSMLLLGVAPSIVIWKLLPRKQSFGLALKEKAAMIGLSFAIVAIAVVPFYKDYASLFRNHREIRYLLTPVNAINGLYGYAKDLAATPVTVTPIGTDAHKGSTWQTVRRPTVGVVVVGETARAASFSLYGYERPTNPRLAARELIRFEDVSACGTSTAVSLPCMFSDLGREAYDRSAVRAREGLLDVLQRAGIRTVWLDNNSGCKGACRNSTTWTTAGLDIPGVCDGGECFDVVLLGRIEQELANVREDSVIVVHMNGSHGPSYYRRYPNEFRVFTPECRSDELADCSQEEIRNSYDNSIRYTDWFLAELIDRLEGATPEIDTSLLYISDHGESLGEFGLYLHGTPYFLAPSEQTRVPMLLWMSDSYRDEFRVDNTCLLNRQALPMSHDNVFHSVLGMMDITTQARQANLDLFKDCMSRTPYRLHGKTETTVGPDRETAVTTPSG